MCGRFEQEAPVKRILEHYNLKAGPTDPDTYPRFNIAPTQSIAVVHEGDGDRILEMQRWGLIPSWAREIGKTPVVNARDDALTVKPFWKGIFQRRRCVIPGTGFYEWQRRAGGGKQPFNIHRPGRELFSFAGLWDEWIGPDARPIRSCAIITTSPNALMEAIHNRMPVILPHAHVDEWLNPANRHISDLLELLVPFAGELEAVPVTTKVGNATYDAPDCIEPLVA